MKWFLQMDLLEAYFQTTSGTWKALLIKRIAITQNLQNLILYVVPSIQGTLRCMDYSSCGHFGHVTHHSSCYGGWHGNSWSALFGSIHSWLSSGIVISKELKIPAGGFLFICIKKGPICLLVLWWSLQFNICSNNFSLVFLLICLGISMLMSCWGHVCGGLPIVDLVLYKLLWIIYC